MTDVNKVAQMLTALLGNLPEDKQEEVTKKLESLFGRMSGMAESKDAFMQLIQSNDGLGEMMYELAMVNKDEGEYPEWSKLDFEHRAFWILLAMRSNFNPSSVRCVCPSCMGEHHEDEEEDDSDGDTGILKVSDKEVADLMANNTLPPELIKILKAKGIDPESISVKIIDASEAFGNKKH